MFYFIKLEFGHLKEFHLTQERVETKTTTNPSFAIKFDSEEQAESFAEFLGETYEIEPWTDETDYEELAEPEE